MLHVVHMVFNFFICTAHGDLSIHLLGMTGLTHLCKNVGQFFTLPLATDVSAQTCLAEFQCTLIL